MKSKYYILRDGDKDNFEFFIERIDDDFVRVTRPDGSQIKIDLRLFGNIVSGLTPDFQAIDMHVSHGVNDVFKVTTPNAAFNIPVLNERKMQMAVATGGLSSGGEPEFKSPMAGKVILIKTPPQTEVEVGDVILVVEAMKMENEIKAHISGTLTSVAVSPNDTVELNDLLFVITPPEEA